MARIVEFRSSEQPHMSMSESLYYRLAEPLIYRDLDGVLGDIPAACCRRCGEVTLRSDEVANHLCTTTERIERLTDVGMQAFRRIVDEQAAQDATGVAARLAFIEASLGGAAYHPAAAFDDLRWLLAQTDRVMAELAAAQAREQALRDAGNALADAAVFASNQFDAVGAWADERLSARERRELMALMAKWSGYEAVIFKRWRAALAAAGGPV